MTNCNEPDKPSINLSCTIFESCATPFFLYDPSTSMQQCAPDMH